MKKFFTMALMSLAFVACNKEENKPETPNEEIDLIEGIWGLESRTLIEDGKPSTSTLDECEKKITWNFSQGKIKIVSYPKKEGKCEEAKTSNATYTISEDKLTLFEEGKDGEAATFTVDKTTLKVITKRGSIIIFKRK